MIKGTDVYEILVALVPLYAAMMLAYGSVRWWKIFTPEQCSGINRFVVVFAAPTLAFNFISSIDPYKMNWKFIAADALQKVVIFVALSLWNTFFTKRGGGLDWTITLFSIATSPNTLLIGVPLLTAMYGEFTRPLMIQMVVMQCVIWFNLSLFLYEYRAAKHFISQQYLETEGSNVKVDSSTVGSVNGGEPLQALDVEMGEGGNLHVMVKSSASSSMIHNPSFHKSHSTSRVSNLAGVGIYSASAREPRKRASSLSFINPTDFFYTSTLQNAGFEDEMLKMHEKRSGRSKSYTGELSTLNSGSMDDGQRKKGVSCGRDYATNVGLPMLVWSSRTSPASRHGVNRVAPADIDTSHPIDVPQEIATSKGVHELIDMSSSPKASRDKENEIEVDIKVGVENKKQQMPAARVMTKLVLIMVWTKLIRNPNTHAALCGLVWSLISSRWNIAMPSIISGSVALLSRTGLGMAMFSLGLFMALQPKILACGKTMAAISTAIKFLVGPAVMASTSAAVGFRGVLLQVAIVQAAIPLGIVPFVFAKEYNVHPEILSTAIIFGTAIAIPIAILYFVLLGL